MHKMINDFNLHRKTISQVLTVLIAVSALGAGCPAQATKLQAKRLPRNGDPSGRTSYNRPDKEFWSSEDNTPALSRFKRRPGYREVEKQRKEEAERKHKEQIAARKQAKIDRDRAYRRKLEQYKKYKQEAIEYNNQAVTFGQQGRWEEAIAAHEKAVQYDQSNKQFRVNLSAARTALGEQKLKSGQFAAAAGLFRKALAAAPDNGMAGKLLTQGLDRMGLDPGDVDVRIKLGDQLLAARDYQGAYIEYQQAMQIDPSAKTYVKMGDMELLYRRVDSAKKWYAQAIVKDPNYAPAHRQLGLLFLSKKDNTGAAASLRKAVILDPDDYAAGHALVDIWRKQVAKNPLSPENHLGLAGALQLTRDFVGAESEYRKLEAINPNHAGLTAGRASLQKAYQHANAEKHRKAAETLFSQGLKAEALAEISQAVMVEPRNAKYQFMLGECLEANHDYKGAHQAYLTCVLIDPENNKEAAARMKQMQQFPGSRPAARQSAVSSSSKFQSRTTSPVNFKTQWRSQPAQSQFRRQTPPSGGSLSAMRNTMIRRGVYEKTPAPTRPAARPMQPSARMPQLSTRPPARAFSVNPTRQVNQAKSFAPPGQTSSFGKNQPSISPARRNEAAASSGSQPRIFPASHAENHIASGGGQNHTVKQQATGGAGNNNQDSSTMALIARAEKQNDYMGAVKLLREMAQSNLQNAGIHHRLAVNLMAAGRISEAVTEFRIASALNPSQKSYADDLARALSVNKRALSGRGGTQ